MEKPNYVRPGADWWKSIEDEWKLGRLIERGDIDAAVRMGLRHSRRSGTSAGQPYRTHHNRVRSFNLVNRRRFRTAVSGPQRRSRLPHASRRERLGCQAERRFRRKVAYITREGHWGRAKPDLLAMGGCTGHELVQVMRSLVDTSHRQDASLFHDIVLELPLEASEREQIACLEHIAGDLARKELPALWALHAHGQPHAHLLVSVRPCRRALDGTWTASEQGRRGMKMPRHLDGPEEVVAWRRFVADSVNQYCRPKVLFHPGRRAETGATGPAERRLWASEFPERRRKLVSDLRDRFHELSRELSNSQSKGNAIEVPQEPVKPTTIQPASPPGFRAPEHRRRWPTQSQKPAHKRNPPSTSAPTKKAPTPNPGGAPGSKPPSAAPQVDTGEWLLEFIGGTDPEATKTYQTRLQSLPSAELFEEANFIRELLRKFNAAASMGSLKVPSEAERIRLFEAYQLAKNLYELRQKRAGVGRKGKSGNELE